MLCLYKLAYNSVEYSESDMVMFSPPLPLFSIVLHVSVCSWPAAVAQQPARAAATAALRSNSPQGPDACTPSTSCWSQSSVSS